jgi:pimeloyl-ACP methyl ester carboxylesterase
VTAQLSIGTARRVTIGRIAALQSGPATGQPVLLLPGYTGSKEDFGPVLDPLAEHGLRITAIDLPGQYESPSLPSPADYAPVRLAGAIDAVIEHLVGSGGSVHLLGHSFGGLVARAAVIATPQRFRSVVLLSSGPAALDGLRRTRIDQLEPLLARTDLPELYAAMQSAAAAEPGFVAPPPDLAEFLQRRFLQGSPIMLQGMADALRAEPDRVARLAATGVPALVVHGAADDAWPPQVQREMARRLGARYEVIQHAAHSAAVENPLALARILVDFWLGASAG